MWLSATIQNYDEKFQTLTLKIYENKSFFKIFLEDTQKHSRYCYKLPVSQEEPVLTT